MRILYDLWKLAKDHPVGTSGSFPVELASYLRWKYKGWFRKYIY